MAYCYDKYDVPVRTSRGYDFYSVVVEEFLDGYDLHKDASEKAAPEPEAVK